MGPPAESLGGAVAEYTSLTDSLKRLPGTDFEDCDHPAVVLDRATGPGTRFWGWWADAEPRLPCLLWVSERGWSATVVEPDALDHEGYERAFWSHRVALLDLALACAIGPCPSLEKLQVQVGLEGSFGFGERSSQLQAAVLWGIVQVRAAQSSHGQCATAPGVCPLEPTSPAHTSAELTFERPGLMTTLARTRIFRAPARLTRR